MDQEKDHPQSLGICQKLHNFIARILAKYALKIVKLGHPLHPSSTPPTPGAVQNAAVLGIDGTVHKQAKVEAEQAANDLSKDDEKLPPVKEPPPSNQPQDKAPKKTVSISETVEEMKPKKKGKKGKKIAERVASMDLETDEEPKPLKSILKVGSNLSGNSFMNRSSSSSMGEPS